ncbi:MAG: flavodoxin domain-containing protein, partial [Gammaproteobacteria bacterium]
MPRFLILYATREGQTAKVAARIADHLRQAGAEATLIDAA